MIDRPNWPAVTPDSGKQEIRTPSVGIVVIDERSPGNILSVPSRGISLLPIGMSDQLSAEGFAHNPDGQGQLADFFITTLGLQTRGPLLDVGFGDNIHVANRFSSRGIPSFALDALTAQNHLDTDTSPWDNLWDPPKIIGINTSGVQIVTGNIAGLGLDTSDLRRQRFGSVLYNGSWDTGGDNYTVGGEMAQAKHANLGITEPLYDYLDREKSMVLQASRDQLTDTGVIGVVSSRYAFHGGGSNYSQLSDEKLSFIDLFMKLKTLGAKKVTMIGLSQEGFDQLVETSVSQNEQQIAQYAPRWNEEDNPSFSYDGLYAVREQLRSPSRITVDETYNYMPVEWNPAGHIQRLKTAAQQAEQVPVFSQLARIDAMFAEF